MPIRDRINHNPRRRRLQPPIRTRPDLAQAFRRLVKSMGTQRFMAIDTPLILSYCEAWLQARHAGQQMAALGAVVGGRPSPWLKVQEAAHRSMAVLAAQLRITPATRTLAKPLEP